MEGRNEEKKKTSKNSLVDSHICVSWCERQQMSEEKSKKRQKKEQGRKITMVDDRQLQ